MVDFKLDEYEQNIEDNILKYKKASKKKRAKVERIIENIREKKNISLRVNIFDLEQLKIKAVKEGIPYQTLISSIIHKFVTDRLVDQNEIIKSIQLLKGQFT